MTPSRPTREARLSDATLHGAARDKDAAFIAEIARDLLACRKALRKILSINYTHPLDRERDVLHDIACKALGRKQP